MTTLSPSVTLYFAWVLLTQMEDPRAFEKYLKARSQREWATKNPEKKKALDAASYQRNRESRLLSMKQYDKENPEVGRAAKRKYYDKNTEVCKQRATAHRRSEPGKEWMRNWSATRRNTNPAFQLEQNARSRIYHALYSQNATKAASGLELLGVESREEFFQKLQEKFVGKFPSGEYGKDWEWDHIRPCASFDLTDSAQQRACFHWTNYQPLPVFENRSKGAKWKSE